MKGFSNAINKALEYTHNHSAKEVAEKISTYFPESSINDLEIMVQNYMDIDAWFDTTYIEEKDFTHIQEIVENAGALDKSVPYDKLVNTKFAKKMD